MKVVIYGTEDCASLANFYLTKDSEHEVVAFTVDEHYLTTTKFEKKPVVAFENIEKEFNSKDFKLFAPLYSNNLRSIKYAQGKEKGYDFISYIHSSCIIYSDIGDNCFIQENNIIQPYVKFGNNNIMWTNNHVGHHSVVGNHCFFASHVVVCGHCNIEDFCWLGSNSAIKESTTLKIETTVAMSAAIVKDTMPNSLYKGIPGKIHQ